MRNLRTQSLVALTVVFLLFGCKKSNKSLPESNYLKIGNDLRQLGLIPSGDVEYESAAWSNPDQWQFIVYIENKCDNIIGLKNNLVRIIVDIWDKNLSKSEYPITDQHQATDKCNIRMDITGNNNLDIFTEALTGKVYITKSESGDLKSVKFTNLNFIGEVYSFNTSASFTIGN